MVESINMLQDILHGDYVTKVDVKDAYFMVPVNKKKKHQNLTGFIWKIKSYQFSCLSFGLSLPPPPPPLGLYRDRKANHDRPEVHEPQDNHV